MTNLRRFGDELELAKNHAKIYLTHRIRSIYPIYIRNGIKNFSF